jgi:hypothetical protein
MQVRHDKQLLQPTSAAVGEGYNRALLQQYLIDARSSVMAG